MTVISQCKVYGYLALLLNRYLISTSLSKVTANRRRDRASRPATMGSQALRRDESLSERFPQRLTSPPQKKRPGVPHCRRAGNRTSTIRSARPYPLAEAVAIERETALRTLQKSIQVTDSFTPIVSDLSTRGPFQQMGFNDKYWFAKLYELVTYHEIQAIDRFEHPAFVLHFIPFFYDLYYQPLQSYRQRHYEKVGPLWSRHFSQGEGPAWNSVSGFVEGVRASVFTGVAAHIQGDMATALERAYRSFVAKYGVSDLPFDMFRRDFFENSRSIFEEAKTTFFSQFTQMVPFAISSGVGQFMMEVGEQVIGGGFDIDEVYRWRAKAWAEARSRLSSATRGSHILRQ